MLYGCEGVSYCGRKLEVSVDDSTWSTVIERSTYYDAWILFTLQQFYDLHSDILCWSMSVCVYTLLSAMVPREKTQYCHFVLSVPPGAFGDGFSRLSQVLRKDDDTAPTVEYDDAEDSHGTIFRFDLRPVRYVRVSSSISSTATAVHFAEIVSCRNLLNMSNF